MARLGRNHPSGPFSFSRPHSSLTHTPIPSPQPLPCGPYCQFCPHQQSTAHPSPRRPGPSSLQKNRPRRCTSGGPGIQVSFPHESCNQLRLSCSNGASAISVGLKATDSAPAASTYLRRTFRGHCSHLTESPDLSPRTHKTTEPQCSFLHCQSR